jgi:hypothetical protein
MTRSPFCGTVFKSDSSHAHSGFVIKFKTAPRAFALHLKVIRVDFLRAAFWWFTAFKAATESH